jgi:hypothetical protein
MKTIWDDFRNGDGSFYIFFCMEVLGWIMEEWEAICKEIWARMLVLILRGYETGWVGAGAWWMNDMVVFEIRRTYAERKIQRRCVLGEGWSKNRTEVEIDWGKCLWWEVVIVTEGRKNDGKKWTKIDEEIGRKQSLRSSELASEIAMILHVR